MSESFFIEFSKDDQAISILPFIDENSGYVQGVRFWVEGNTVEFEVPAPSFT